MHIRPDRIISKKQGHLKDGTDAGIGYKAKRELHRLCWACNGAKWGEDWNEMLKTAAAIYDNYYEIFVRMWVLSTTYKMMDAFLFILIIWLAYLLFSLSLCSHRWNENNKDKDLVSLAMARHLQTHHYQELQRMGIIAEMVVDEEDRKITFIVDKQRLKGRILDLFPRQEQRLEYDTDIDIFGKLSDNPHHDLWRRLDRTFRHEVPLYRLPVNIKQFLQSS